MGKIEDIMLDFLAQPEVMADLFNGYVFNGKLVIQPDMLKEKENKTRFLLEKEKKNRKKKSTYEVLKRERDIVREVIIGKQRLKLMIVGVEEQTRIDYSMPLRVLTYDTLEYLKQAKKIEREHKRKKDLKDAEYLTGFAKEDKLIPTVTIVVYAGREKWDGAYNLEEMFGDEIYTKLLSPYMVKAPLNLFSIYDIKNTNKYHGSLKKLLNLLKFSENGKELEQYLKTHREEYMNLDQATVKVIELLLDLEIMTEEEEKEEVDMCKAIEEIREMGKADGRCEGRNEERMKNARNLLDVLDLTTIIQKLNLTDEEAAQLAKEINN